MSTTCARLSLRFRIDGTSAEPAIASADQSAGKSKTFRWIRNKVSGIFETSPAQSLTDYFSIVFSSSSFVSFLLCLWIQIGLVGWLANGTQSIDGTADDTIHNRHNQIDVKRKIRVTCWRTSSAAIGTDQTVRFFVGQRHRHQHPWIRMQRRALAGQSIVADFVDQSIIVRFVGGRTSCEIEWQWTAVAATATRLRYGSSVKGQFGGNRIATMSQLTHRRRRWTRIQVWRFVQRFVGYWIGFGTESRASRIAQF